MKSDATAAARHSFRVVLFDIGGVLVELTGVRVLLSWMGTRLDAEEVFALWLRSPSVRLFETGRLAPEPFADQLIAELSLPIGPEEFLRSFCSWTQGLLPGALEVVRKVPSQYLRATLSNSNELQWPCLMHDMKLEKEFDRHFASHITGKIKPDPDAFQHVVDCIGCEAECILFLDDNRLNVDAARQVGMRAVRVKGPAEAAQALRQAGILEDDER
jgi:putative hydrolase of the HAD superfamily